jgi:N-acetylmuramoyl-L-alanine amidase
VSSAGLSGKVVAIDPGHNGGNEDHPEIINQLIDGGYGQRNVCNTTGTETDEHYPEHEFTWHVASYLKPLLEAKGITVVMTRSNDTSVGPCTNKRAAIENNADADAVVSIHGDGAPPEVRGFYVLTATRPPAGPTIAAESLRLAACIAKAAVNEGLPASNTLGSGGLWKRDDLTGLNLSMRPKILIECGNMRNATEAALMSSSSGQQRYAQALAQGVFSYLKG